MEGREGGGGGGGEAPRGARRGKKKVVTAKEYERANKPFRAPNQPLPTIAQQWAYAARRYSKYQGYAWSGVVAVAALAYAASYASEDPKKEGKAAAPK